MNFNLVRVMIAFGLFVFIAPFVNGEVVLNSCGVPGGGWQENEDYLINVSVASVNPCFNFNAVGVLHNLTFTQISPVINETVAGGYIFNLANYPVTLINVSFNNFNIVGDGVQVGFLRTINTNANTNSLQFARFNNITMHNMSVFIALTCGGTSINVLRYLTMENLYLVGSPATTLGIVYKSGSLTSGICRFWDAEFKNSFFYFRGYELAETGSGALSVTNATFTDSVFGRLNDYVGTKITAENSIIFGKTVLDANHDGFGDSNPYTGITNSRIYYDLFGVRFLQDFSQGDFFESTNLSNILVNDEELFDGYAIKDGTDVDFSLVNETINPSSFYYQLRMIGTDSNALCEFLPSVGNCNIDTRNATTVDTSPSLGRGIIAMSGQNHSITDLTFDTGGSTYANLIANYGTNTISNINIQNNIFNIHNGSWVQTVAVDSNWSTRQFQVGHQIIMLKANNVEIKNNLFNVTGDDTDGSEDFRIMTLLSTNPMTNTITENIFKQEISPANGTVFAYYCDAKFYNNYIGSGVIIEDNLTFLSCKDDIIINPYIGFYNSGDDSFYYYHIGNYYEDYGACVDVDNNGICDSPYTSGDILDNYPLSSYPFNFSVHLFTAEEVVTNGTYNVTLVGITPNETVHLASSGSSIILSFSEDGDYPDLTCYYILDGATIATENTVVKNTVYNYTKTGSWTTKTYTYRVECYNDAQGYVSSPEYNLNVIVDSETDVCGNAILETGETCDDGNTVSGDGCSATCQIEGGGGAICGNGVWETGETCDDGNTVSGDGCSATCQIESGGGTGEFNYTYDTNPIDFNDIDATNENTIGFLENIMAFILNMAIPICTLIVIMMLVFAMIKVMI